ncbi:MAG: PadR family transcriptional regulator, partial [Bacteroidales bacterium]|nr:PadR family transcriptional regulator [Candidatus Latescibacterota bacterium]
IKDEISEMSGRSVSYGTLYSYLDQLYRKNLVNKRSGDPSPERGGRRKIFYNVTKKGMAALKAAHELSNSVWTDATELLK